MTLAVAYWTGIVILAAAVSCVAIGIGRLWRAIHDRR